MDWLLNNLPAIILVLGFVAGYYNYLKDHDPNLASKIKVIGDLANYAVSLQATKAYSNSKKQEEATKAVMEQAKAIGIKVTEATAKGAVEQAVSEAKEVKKPEPIQAKDIPSANIPAKVEVKEQTTEQPKAEEPKLTLIDHLEVK
ncbi:phage holin [Lactobacillus mulieris]|jgi:phage holin, LL-H family|uniref:Phage holin n=1 Tax=Lactobacillus mulieris TaxID=2508708 RepID=A0ABT4K2Z1_9LACO|nr:phage holin [Lactobacillus mulieris]MCZ3621855.1 phage holin [Lactobacillus mulieris]MCZ3623552.1 phage holin [Lactobacillus mulieris]MCZ3635862.1 phage holin [Lactobacillus mulieris]DAT07850.1 MAG TPA: holin [Caudoviricetes sp.]